MHIWKKDTGIVAIRSFYGRKSLFIRIVASQALVGAILVALISIYLFQRFSVNSIREITRASTDSLQQSIRVFDTLWDGTYRYMNKEFLTNGMLMDAKNGKEFDPVLAGDVFRYLGNIVSNSGLFQSVYLYNGNADRMYSSLGPVQAADDFYDSGIVALLRSGTLQVDKPSYNVVVYRRMNLGNGISPVGLNVLSVIYSDNGFTSAMIFNLDLQVLQKLVAKRAEDASARLLVMGSDGTILADSSGQDMMKDFSSTQVFLEISPKQNGGAVIQVLDNRKSLLAWQLWSRQANMKWWFVSIADYRSLLSGVSALQRQVLGVAGLFMIFSILISLLFSRSIYRPISKLLERIRTGQGANQRAGQSTILTSHISQGKSMSELEYLSQAYDSLTSDVARLLSFETVGRGAVRRDLLLRLLHGGVVTKVEMARVLYDKPWFFASEGFRTVAIRFDGQTLLSLQHSADDMALLRFAVLNIAGELSGNVMGVETVEVSEEWLCLILHADDPKETSPNQMERIHAVLASIREACRVHLSLSITAGVGEEMPLSVNLPQSWKQAVNASGYRLTEGAGSILFYKELHNRHSRVYRYPAEAERDVLESLRSSDVLRLESALDRFLRDVSVYAVPEVRLALAQFAMVTRRVLEGVLSPDGLSDERLNLSPEVAETLSGIRTAWLAQLSKGMDLMRRKREARHDEQLGKVRDRVETAYCDANLTVESLADEAGLSANYLRTLYKEANGQSITEHIAFLRFREAKRMLRGTDLPANRIAGKIGYQSSGYFYTAFRKATGMTPDEYRRSGDK